MNDMTTENEMTPASIRHRIHVFILDTLLVGEAPVNLTDETPLISGGIIDSINVVKVGAFLERTFSITAAPDELLDPHNMETIDLMVKLVMSRALRSTGASV
jgi:acyl carrier protein